MDYITKRRPNIKKEVKVNLDEPHYQMFLKLKQEIEEEAGKSVSNSRVFVVALERLT